MKLEDVVAARYERYVSCKEVILKIAQAYQCSENDAKHVLADALMGCDEEPLMLEQGKLGPKPLDDYERAHIWRSLQNTYISVEEGVKSGLPF